MLCRIFSNIYIQVLTCQGAGVAVPGLYPLLFPPNGYHGQLRWLANTSACIGPESYSILLSASKEGKVVLPKHIVLKTSSGKTINIGEKLTSPNSKKVDRMPLLFVHSSESSYEVTHASTLRNEEGREEVEKVNGDTFIEGEEEEGEEEEMLEAFAKEKTEEKLGYDKMCRKLQVEACEKIVSKAELFAHFSNYGEVEEVSASEDGYAEVVFSRAGSARHCLSLEHSLEQECSLPIRLRVKGGSGRPPPAPPRQLQHNVNPFR